MKDTCEICGFKTKMPDTYMRIVTMPGYRSWRGIPLEDHTVCSHSAACQRRLLRKMKYGSFRFIRHTDLVYFEQVQYWMKTNVNRWRSRHRTSAHV
jgi:hypothetical protein